MTSRHPLGAVLTALVAAVALLLSSCSPQEGEDASISVGYTAELDGLDPSTVEGAATSMVFLYNVYETLVRADHEGGIVPLLATDWEVSDDRLTYTFHLEPDAKFASGEDLNADAVVTSLNYSRGADTTHGTVRELLPRQHSVVEDVQAVDEHTVEITLNEPSNMWLFHMTGPAGIIYDPTGMDNLDTQPAGSGPYTFLEWDSGSHLTLQRNDEYWGEPAGVGEVVWRRYGDPNAMTSAMLSGQLDIISNLTTPESLPQFDDESRYKVLAGYSNGEVVLGYNHQNEALQDVRVRQAITHAINRQGLMDSIWGGQGTLIGSMVPPQDPWYTDLSETYPYDHEKAKALLAEAGYESGLSLRLRVPILPYATTGGRYVASELQAVGINVQLEEVEWATWLEEIFGNGDYDMTIVAHVEPRDMDMFANPESYWHYDNPEYQELLIEADRGTSEEQVELLRQASELLTQDAAATWLFLLPNLPITTAEISGIEPNSTNLSFDLTKVRIDQ